MYVAPPEQSSPALKQPPAPEAGATPQRPSAAPDALLHRPAQHSKSFVQTSPLCVQKEGVLEQKPPLQYCEQQSVLLAQGLPDVLHPVLSAAQVPAVHLPPQHSPSAAHAALSALQ